MNKQKVSQFQFIMPSAYGEDFYNIQFEGNNQEWGIQLGDLIYFKADLTKGVNEITVEYDSYPEFNTYGILREYKIQYALYPSNYWKYFGPITANINLPNQDEIRDINIGELKDLGNGKY